MLFNKKNKQLNEYQRKLDVIYPQGELGTLCFNNDVVKYVDNSFNIESKIESEEFLHSFNINPSNVDFSIVSAVNFSDFPSLEPLMNGIVLRSTLNYLVNENNSKEKKLVVNHYFAISVTKDCMDIKHLESSVRKNSLPETVDLTFINKNYVQKSVNKNNLKLIRLND